jgi:hypothetical protein
MTIEKQQQKLLPEILELSWKGLASKKQLEEWQKKQRTANMI